MQLNDLVRLRSDPTGRKMRVVALQDGNARCIWHGVTGRIWGETYPVASLVSEPDQLSAFWEQRQAD